MIVVVMSGKYDPTSYVKFFTICEKHKVTIKNTYSHFMSGFFTLTAQLQVSWVNSPKLVTALTKIPDVITTCHTTDQAIVKPVDGVCVFEVDFHVANPSSFPVASLIKLLLQNNNILFNLTIENKILPIAQAPIINGNATVGILGSAANALLQLEELAEQARSDDILTYYSLKTT